MNIQVRVVMVSYLNIMSVQARSHVLISESVTEILDGQTYFRFYNDKSENHSFIKKSSTKSIFKYHKTFIFTKSGLIKVYGKV